jgi:hypothetical protein
MQPTGVLSRRRETRGNAEGEEQEYDNTEQYEIDEDRTIST